MRKLMPIMMALLIINTSGAVAWAQEADASSDVAASNVVESAAADANSEQEAIASDGASEEPAAVVAAAVVEPAAPEAAEAPADSAASEPVIVHLSNDLKDDDEFVPYAGTAFSYSNSIAPYSLVKSGYLSYNPYYAMDFGFKLSWWFNKHLNIYGNLSVNREITQADDTTYKNEAWLSDTTIGLMYHNLYQIPVVGIDINLGGRIILPTSKVSKAQTSIFDLGVDLTLARKFKVLKGIQISYSLKPKYNFHRYTTGESVSPRVSVASVKDGNYDALLSNGVRNVQFDLGNDISFAMAFTDWMGFGFSWGRIICWLYDLTDDDNAINPISYRVENPQNRRYIDYFNLYVNFTPVQFLDVTVLASTAYAQLDMEGQYRTPFFNQYTTLSLDLSFNFAELGKFIKSHKKK